MKLNIKKIQKKIKKKIKIDFLPPWKGAIDGGIHIPHNPKIFPQKKAEKKPKVVIPAKKEKGKKEDKKKKKKR